MESQFAPFLITLEQRNGLPTPREHGREQAAHQCRVALVFLPKVHHSMRIVSQKVPGIASVVTRWWERLAVERVCQDYCPKWLEEAALSSGGPFLSIEQG